jgi:hypothetical protein
LQAAGETRLARQAGLGPDLGILESTEGLTVTFPRPIKAGFTEDDGGAVFEVEYKGGSYRLDARLYKSYKEQADEPPARATVHPPSW